MQGRSLALHHRHDEMEDVGGIGAAVDEVAEEDGFAGMGWGDGEGIGAARGGAGRTTAAALPRGIGGAGDGVAELCEEFVEFVEAAVNVADDVEGAGVPFAVVPERLALDARLVRLLRGNSARERSENLRVRVRGATGGVAANAGRMTCEPKLRSGRWRLRSWQSFSGQIQDDGDGQDIMLVRQSDERLARFGLNIGGVDDGEQAAGKPLGGDEFERRRRRRRWRPGCSRRC